MENKNTKKILELLDKVREKVESGEIDALVISGCGENIAVEQVCGNPFATIGLAKSIYDKTLQKGKKEDGAIDIMNILSGLLDED